MDEDSPESQQLDAVTDDDWSTSEFPRMQCSDLDKEIVLQIASDDFLQTTLHRVGRKWAVNVLADLYLRSTRFNTIRRDLSGVSQRSLSLVMHSLLRDGLVNRTVFPVIPPRVNYELTELGVSLIEALLPVARWSKTYADHIVAANVHYDSEHDEADNELFS